MRLWQLVVCQVQPLSAQPYSCMPSRIVYWSHSITREYRNMQTVSCCATSGCQRAIPVEIALHCHVIRHVEHSSQVCKPARNFEVSSFDPPFLSGLFPQAISGAKLTLYKETTEKVLMVTGNQRQCTVSLDGYQLLQIGKFLPLKRFVGISFVTQHQLCFVWGRRGKYVHSSHMQAQFHMHKQQVPDSLVFLSLSGLTFRNPRFNICIYSEF